MLLDEMTIKKDLKAMRNSFLGYLISILWILFIFWFSTIAGPMIVFCGIIAIWMFIKATYEDMRLRFGKWYVITRKCIDKTIVEDDEGPDTYRLWFLNRNGDWNVSIEVEKERYDACEIDDEYHVVFIEGKKIPVLCYEASKYQLSI